MDSPEKATVDADLLGRALIELRQYAHEVHEELDHRGAIEECQADTCPGRMKLVAELDASRPRPLTAEGLRQTLAVVRRVYDAQGQYEPVALAALAWGERAAARIAELEGIPLG